MLYEEFERDSNIKGISYQTYKDTYEVVYANKNFYNKQEFYKYARKQGQEAIAAEAQLIHDNELILHNLYKLDWHNGIEYLPGKETHLADAMEKIIEAQGYKLNIEYIKDKAEKEARSERQEYLDTLTAENEKARRQHDWNCKRSFETGKEEGREEMKKEIMDKIFNNLMKSA